MTIPNRGNETSFTLSPTEAIGRLRIILLFSIVLWLGTWLAILTHADRALLQEVNTSALLNAWHAALTRFSYWSLFVFYAFFIALIVYGIRSRRPLFKLIGLAYFYAQLFGTLILTYAIKIGCGRPRPLVMPGHDAMCLSPSFTHAFHSFPSSHAVNTGIGALFILLLLRSRLAGLSAIAIALSMALSRIALSEHYLSDVLAGLALSAAVTSMVMRLYLLPRWQTIEADRAWQSVPGFNAVPPPRRYPVQVSHRGSPLPVDGGTGKAPAPSTPETA
ncbi:MAG: phosphatase PAP2 family protein [Thiobacillus sp.]|nr:phosphatase PAP2 family protein [Thiobacillus sp.]